MSISYRPEIDGLRTVAVLSVILYHAEISLTNNTLLTNSVPGGFLGVDVFFVISGYLISKIIFNECQEGQFSYLNFYKRRFRRILPVLLLVMGVTTYFSWLSMLPKAMVEYSVSLLSSLGFGSNIWFWLEDSYTAEASDLKPLLHIWSLSVEEQFYIFFPVIALWLFRSFKLYLLKLVFLITVASFLLANWMSYKYPDTSFYLLPFRAWELLAGALLVLWEREGFDRFKQKVRLVHLPTLGLAMILAAVIFLNDEILHPSFYTLIPVVGTMLIIGFAQPNELTVRLLSSWPFVKTGLISYSLYLWHVPIFAISRIHNGDRVNEDMIRYIIYALVYSIVGYFLIEKPFRNSRIIKDRVFYPLMGLAAVFLIGINVYILVKDGVPKRLETHHIELFYQISGQLATRDESGMPCHERPNKDHCVLNAEGTNGTYVLLGDSKAASLSSAVLQVAIDNNAKYVQLSRSSCPYMLGAKYNDNSELDDCGERTLHAPEIIRSLEKPVTIFIQSRISKWVNRGGFYSLSEGVPVEVSIRRAFEEFTRDEYRLVIIYPSPEPDGHLPRAIKRELDEKGVSLAELDISTSLEEFKQHSAKAGALLDSIGKGNPNIVRIYPEKVICSEKTGRCPGHDANSLYFMDGHHLSIHGAQLVYPLLQDGVTQLSLFTTAE